MSEAGKEEEEAGLPFFPARVIALLLLLLLLLLEEEVSSIIFHTLTI